MSVRLPGIPDQLHVVPLVRSGDRPALDLHALTHSRRLNRWRLCWDITEIRFFQSFETVFLNPSYPIFLIRFRWTLTDFDWFPENLILERCSLEMNSWKLSDLSAKSRELLTVVWTAVRLAHLWDFPSGNQLNFPDLLQILAQTKTPGLAVLDSISQFLSEIRTRQLETRNCTSFADLRAWSSVVG